MYRDLFRRHHVPCGLENGDLNMLWAVPEVANERNGRCSCAEDIILHDGETIPEDDPFCSLGCEE